MTKPTAVEIRLDHIEETNRDQWRAINRMRAWVIGGMGALIAQLAVALLERSKG